MKFANDKYDDPASDDDDNNSNNNTFFSQKSKNGYSSRRQLQHQGEKLPNPAATSLQQLSSVAVNDDGDEAEENDSPSQSPFRESSHGNCESIASNPLTRIGRGRHGYGTESASENEDGQLSSRGSKRPRQIHAQPEDDDDEEPIEMSCDIARRSLLKDHDKADPYDRVNCFFCVRKTFVVYKDPPHIQPVSIPNDQSRQSTENSNPSVSVITPSLPPPPPQLPLPMTSEHARLFLQNTEDNEVSCCSSEHSEDGAGYNAPTKLEFRYPQVPDDVIFALNQRMREAINEGNFESECIIIANWFNEQAQKINDEINTYNALIKIPKVTGINLKNHYLYHQSTTEAGIFKKHREVDDIMDHLKQNILVENKRTN